jgi:hypothetical protein
MVLKDLPAGAAYTANRAAGLAGVPVSTLHYWSRSGIWVSSVSSVKVKRWSYSDLVALRLVDWLRRDKPDLKLPRASMARVRGALAALDRWGDRLTSHSVKIWVDSKGGLVIEADGETFVSGPGGLAQTVAHREGLDLMAVWQGNKGVLGPHLFPSDPSGEVVRRTACR